MKEYLGATVYYSGRFLQAFAMWILLVDIFMAGPMGPAPKPFYIGIVMFLVGWLMVRSQVARNKADQEIGRSRKE